LEQNRALRRASEDQYLATMLALDKSFVPFPDEPGIEFPKLSTWRVLSKLRKERYEVSDIPEDMKGRELSNRTLRMLEDEIEIPEEFRTQAAPLGKIFQYFTMELSKTGRELPMWIDEQAFKEDTPEGVNLVDASIKFPALIKKMPIAVALRVALSQ